MGIGDPICVVCLLAATYIAAWPLARKLYNAHGGNRNRGLESVSDGYGKAAPDIEDESVSEAERLAAKARLLEELSGLNLTHRQQLLAARFVCRPDPSSPPDRQEYLTIRRDIVGNRQARVVNRCRFDSSQTVSEEHIAGYCCNPGYAQCPFWRSKEDIAA